MSEVKTCSLELDIMASAYISDKVKASDYYGQNLYAALCNNVFKKIFNGSAQEQIVNILKGDYNTWSCSWRYAGGIIADIKEDGDYMDWYCSGIGTGSQSNDLKYVSEGHITEEIKKDLESLGWIPVIDNIDE